MKNEKTFKINVFERIGTCNAVLEEDGETIYRTIETCLRNNIKPQVSFLNIECFTTSFLFAAIGQLYSKFEDDNIKENVALEDLSPQDVVLFHHIIKHSKVHYNSK